MDPLIIGAVRTKWKQSLVLFRRKECDGLVFCTPYLNWQLKAIISLAMTFQSSRICLETTILITRTTESCTEAPPLSADSCSVMELLYTPAVTGQTQVSLRTLIMSHNECCFSTASTGRLICTSVVYYLRCAGAEK